MKKILSIGLLLLVWACEKNDVFEYSQAKSSIHFNYEVKNMALEHDIAFRHRGNVYFGDSLRKDTVKLAVTVLGEKSQEDRWFDLKAIPVKDQDTAMLAEVEFMNPYCFRAGRFKDTVEIILVRADKRGRYTVGITFDITESSDFERGAEEHSVYTVHVLDRYPKPASWDFCIGYVGEYTEEKYAFYVTVMKDIFPQYWWNLDESYTRILNEALDRYNATHPENPKDFDFPRL